MIRRTLALTGLVTVAACTSAAAAPTDATLRVEGTSATLLDETRFTTDTRTVPVGDCADGTETREIPGATALGIVEDGSRTGAYTYDSSDFGPGPGDLFLCRIGPDQTPADFSSFWLYKVNNDLPETTAAGAFALNGGDRVLWYITSDFNAPTLEIAAAARAATGDQVGAAVTAYDNDAVASPGGGTQVTASGPVTLTQTAADDGRATFSFDQPGLYRLKAERADAIRSNAATVCVYVSGSGGCGTEPAPGTAPSGPQLPSGPEAVRDTNAPRAFISGIRDGRTYRRGRAPRVLRGRVEEDRGIHQVYLRVRMIDGRGCRWLSGRSETFSRPRSCDRARYIRLGDSADWSYQLPFELRGGARYIVDVKVLDRGLNKDTEQVRFRVAG